MSSGTGPRKKKKLSKYPKNCSPHQRFWCISIPSTSWCDASANGVSSVLAHRFEDGSKRPIGYASRSLALAERNYSQLEKEGLACIFGVKRFHSYLYGHPFELITDHKPLLALIGEHRPTSPQASARIKRWSLLLAAYEYTLTFWGTHLHQNADALNRLPLPSAPALLLKYQHCRSWSCSWSTCKTHQSQP